MTGTVGRKAPASQSRVPVEGLGFASMIGTPASQSTLSWEAHHLILCNLGPFPHFDGVALLCKLGEVNSPIRLVDQM